jgi:hypothetical protein
VKGLGFIAFLCLLFGLIVGYQIGDREPDEVRHDTLLIPQAPVAIQPVSGHAHAITTIRPTASVRPLYDSTHIAISPDSLPADVVEKSAIFPILLGDSARTYEMRGELSVYYVSAFDQFRYEMKNMTLSLPPAKVIYITNTYHVPLWQKVAMVAGGIATYELIRGEKPLEAILVGGVTLTFILVEF